jgi:hypothetical protein
VIGMRYIGPFASTSHCMLCHTPIFILLPLVYHTFWPVLLRCIADASDSRDFSPCFAARTRLHPK